MSGVFNIGVPMGAVTAMKIVDSDSVVLDLGAAIIGGIAGGMAADLLADSWREKEERRKAEAALSYSEI